MPFRQRDFPAGALYRGAQFIRSFILHPGPLRAANLFSLGRDHLTLGIAPGPIGLLQFGTLPPNRLFAGRLRRMGPLQICFGLGLEIGKLINFKQQPVPLPGREGQIHLLEFVKNLPVTPGFTRLTLERPHLPAHLPQNIGQAEQVRLSPLKLPLGLSLLNLETHHPGSFLKNGPTILGARGKNLVNLALLHDGIGGATDSGVEEQPLNILQAAVGSVNGILAYSVAEDPTSDLDFVVISSENGFAVAKG